MGSESLRFTEITVQGAAGDVIANGINDHGDITGSFTRPAPGQFTQAFVDKHGTITPLTLPLGPSTGNSINAAGDVVGSYGNAVISQNGYKLAADGTFTKVSSAPNQPSQVIDKAFGINDRGDVVGEDFVGHRAGFLWHDGQMTFLQYPGAARTEAHGIANNGTIVGLFSDGQGPTHAFVERNGHFRELHIPGAVSAEADAISSDGDEIAGSFTDAVGRSHGWLLERGHVRTVDVPGAVSTEVHGVNDRGAVVGSYSVANDPSQHAFVALPKHPHS